MKGSLAEVRSIRAIERTRSISAAADELGVSQPALSARLKKAESRFGTQIFDRSRTPLTLTDAGRLYLEYADRADKLDREFAQRLSDIEHLQAGRLVVGGSTSFNISYLAKSIAVFTQRYPGIEVEVVDDTAPALASAALEGSIDLFVSPRADGGDEFEYEELCVERALLCVPPAWDVVSELPFPSGGKAYAEIGHEELGRLAALPFVVLHEGQQIGRMLRALFARHGLAPAHMITVEQTLTGLALTLSGAGVSLVPEATLAIGCYRDTPALYLVDEDLCSRTLYVVRPKNRYVSRAALEFAALLRGGSR